MASQPAVKVKTDKEFTDKERKLIQELRQYQFAEVKVEMRDGQPYRVLGGIRSKML